MDILKALWEYRFIIVMIVAIVLYACFEWEKFKSKAYALMLQAKRLAKDDILKSGPEQVDWIVKALYPIIPIKYRWLLSEERLRSLIDLLYNKAKDFLDDGKLNNSL